MQRSIVVLGLCVASCTFDDVKVAAVDAGGDGDVCASRCEGDVLVACGPGGDERTACPLGCVEQGAARCVRMVPSNGADYSDLDSIPAAPFVVPGGRTYTIDTDSGRIIDDAGAVVRAATVAGGLHEGTGTYFARRTDNVSLLSVDSLVVEVGATLKADGDRALILLARGAILVRGAIDVSAAAPATAPVRSAAGPVVVTAAPSTAWREAAHLAVEVRGLQVAVSQVSKAGAAAVALAKAAQSAAALAAKTCHGVAARQGDHRAPAQGRRSTPWEVAPAAELAAWVT
jgi:hypothetical protein